MKNKASISAFFSKIIRNNTFLMILSVILALFAWIYILYVLNPVNEVTVDEVKVDLSYEGSIPDKNGYMYLMSDPNLSVRVKVSGSRTELFNISAEDLKATLNMNSVISEGTYSVNVEVTPKNENLKVTDIYPKNFTIEFASEETREIPIELSPTGTLPNGYVIDKQEILPATVTVTGPAKTVRTISKALLSVPLTNVKEDVNASYDIKLINEAGESVDRRYLTLSDASAQTLLSVVYRKNLTTYANLTNPCGGNKIDALISVSLDVPTLQATGPENELSGLEKISVGTIDSSAISKNATLTLKLPTSETVSYNANEVNATVTLASGVVTKKLTFKTSDITCINIPTDKIPQINQGSITIVVRGFSDSIKNLTTQNLKCNIDLSEQNEDGTYPVTLLHTAAISDIPFDVVGTYGAKVTLQ